MRNTSNEGASRYSRKSFLTRLGVGAATVSAGGFVRAEEATAQTGRAHRGYGSVSGHFGRIFHDLPPFASQSPQVEAALRDIGKPGGILDARDALDRGPVLGNGVPDDRGSDADDLLGPMGDDLVVGLRGGPANPLEVKAGTRLQREVAVVDRGDEVRGLDRRRVGPVNRRELRR